jgi:hypothetical protein
LCKDEVELTADRIITQDSVFFSEVMCFVVIVYRVHCWVIYIRGVSKKFGELPDISKTTWARCPRMHMAIQRYIEKRHLE